MPQGSMFLVPPGVPIAAGGSVHWHRPDPENAYSRILWMQIHQGGGNCHFSTSTRGQLRSHPYTFIYNKNLLPLAFALIQEMQNAAPYHQPVVHYQLGLMVRYMQRAFEAVEALSMHSASLLHPAILSEMATSSGPDLHWLHPASQTQSVAERAASLIEERLRDTSFTVESLAQHLQISPSQLNRIFRREYNSSVMAFVQERRLEHARQLLAESSFSITQVSTHCGYGSASAFIKAFTRKHGLTPVQFRQRQYTNARPYR